MVCGGRDAGLPACHRALLLWESVSTMSHGFGADIAPSPPLALPGEHPVQGLGSSAGGCGLPPP